VGPAFQFTFDRVGITRPDGNRHSFAEMMTTAMRKLRSFTDGVAMEQGILIRSPVRGIDTARTFSYVDNR
jgi:hypothetical protein